MRKHYYKYLFLLLLTSCATLGYDDHSRPIPRQAGRYFTLSLKDNGSVSTKIPLLRIEKPLNYESGWDTDDVVLVFKSPLIKEKESSSWSWNSQNWWTLFRLKSNPPFGYRGSFAARIMDGEIRLLCGSTGQFLVDLKTVYLRYN